MDDLALCSDAVLILRALGTMRLEVVGLQETTNSGRNTNCIYMRRENIVVASEKSPTYPQSREMRRCRDDVTEPFPSYLRAE